MKEISAYERDPYRRELSVEVVDVEVQAEGCRAWLDDTILYPEGGGQPSDRGWIDGVLVERVEKGSRGPIHLLAQAIEPGPAALVLDWRRRYDHMQQHTAQHLLTREALDRFGWATRSFHIGPQLSDIELDCPPPDRRAIEELEEGVARVIGQARPIRGYRVSREHYEALDVRSRGLPADHSGSIRLVEIEDFDLNTCGGTHVASTAEVEALKVVGSEPLRGGCRLSWVAGRRVRRRLATDLGHLAELRSLLDCADEDLASSVRRKLRDLRDLRRRERRLEMKLAEAAAQRLAGSSERVVEAHLEQGDSSLLRPLAESLVEAAADKIALLTCETDGGALFLVALGKELSLDPTSIGLEVSRILGARGGGAGRIFQGKAEKLTQLPKALAYLRQLSGRESF